MHFSCFNRLISPVGTSAHYSLSFCQSEMLTRFESHWPPVGAAKTKIPSSSTPRKGKQNKRFSADRKKRATNYLSDSCLLVSCGLCQNLSTKLSLGLLLKGLKLWEGLRKNSIQKWNKVTSSQKSPKIASEHFHMRQNSGLQYSWCWKT